jgi:hypothetical protein
MKFSDQDLSQLFGNQFSTTYNLQCEWDAEDRKLTTRQDCLLQLVSQQKIVHVGCVDHNIEAINKKIKKGEWLHAQLCDNTEKCLGIDINQTGIDYIKNELDIPLVECLNMGTETSSLITRDHWHALVLAEIVEHFDNPVAFLTNIRQRYHAHVDNIIVTVPNAWALKNFYNAKDHRERINSDHRFWFTPYTIAKVLVQSGYTIDHMRFCVRKKPKNRKFGKEAKLKKYPLFRNGIVVVASMSPDPA